MWTFDAIHSIFQDLDWNIRHEGFQVAWDAQGT